MIYRDIHRFLCAGWAGLCFTAPLSKTNADGNTAGLEVSVLVHLAPVHMLSYCPCFHFTSKKFFHTSCITTQLSCVTTFEQNVFNKKKTFILFMYYFFLFLLLQICFMPAGTTPGFHYFTCTHFLVCPCPHQSHVVLLILKSGTCLIGCDQTKCD